jgi:Ca2+-binding EF-hand superfamily protein
MGNCVGAKGVKKDPKVLTEEEIKLLLDNTRLTRPQIIALHRNFLKECPTGKLTKKDFIKLFKEVHPSENKKEKADKFCEYVFKVIDTNNLGYISFQDFVLCFSLTSDGDFRQKCEFAFKLYDLDKDGKISKKEMTQVLTALYDLSGITDRKKNNAPAKKVEDIIRKINLTYQPPAAPAPAPAESHAHAEPAHAADAHASPEDKKAAKKAEKERKDKEAKEKKEAEKAKKEKEAKEKKAAASPAKPAKAAKPVAVKAPEYITKDQFIDACTQDETLKKLFVDSIFCNHGDGSEAAANALNNLGAHNAAELHLTGPSFSLNSGGLSLTAPSVELKTASSSSSDKQNEPAAACSVVSETVTVEPPVLTAAAHVEPNSDVNGVYNIREETNYVTSYSLAVGETSGEKPVESPAAAAAPAEAAAEAEKQQ